MSAKHKDCRSHSPKTISMSDHSDSPFSRDAPKLELVSAINTSPNKSMSFPSPHFSTPNFNIESDVPNSFYSQNMRPGSEKSPTVHRFTEPPPSIENNNMGLHNSSQQPSRVDLKVPPPSCNIPSMSCTNSEHLKTVAPVDRLPGEFPDIPQDIHLKCLELMKDNPNGLLINDFKIAFEKINNKIPLNYTRYGYRNLQDCLLTMTNSLRINLNSTNDFVVMPSPQFCEEWASQIRAKQKAIERKRKKNNQKMCDKDQAGLKENDPNYNKSAFTSSDIRRYAAEETPPVTSKVKYSIEFIICSKIEVKNPLMVLYF